VTDDLRVSELEEWFIGEAFEVVHMVKRSYFERGADLVLQKLKEELSGYF
jgi:hypothetical protein